MRSALNKTASAAERLDYIFEFISYYKNPYNGERMNKAGVPIDFSMCFMNISPTQFGLTSLSEMKFYLEVLEEEGLIKLDRKTNEIVEELSKRMQYPKYGTITFKGLKYLAALEREGILSNKCFVAMLFDDKKEERLDAIRRACIEFGFDAFIVNGHRTKDNQTIDAAIVAGLKSARFCIADFTGINHGAYMEAGFAMGRDMKVIFICEEQDFKENRKHFDVNHYPFLTYSSFEELTSKLKIEIAAYIKE